MAERCVYLTGATDSYFLLVLPLLESFARYADRGEKLYVCDFGLSDPQKKYLEKRGLLLSRPVSLEPGLHPYRYKASMGLFAQGLAYDAIVWIDSDCLVVGPLNRAVAAVMDAQSRGGDFLAICQDQGGSMADMIQNFAMEPFARLLDRSGISRDKPYLNCAVFILRSPAILKDWQEQVLDLEIHPLFEQNLLNCLAYGKLPEVKLLDREVWNVHDLDLDRLEVHGDFMETHSRVLLGDKVVLVIHATSFGERTVTFESVRFPVSDGYFIEGLFRMVKNIPVRDLFFTFVSCYLIGNKRDLIECGVVRR
ncbi:MAG: hypothetical protein HW380_3093 [Magnetococcales bacterium]|nr:hypothetical protein [Magnetococcales bacterium]HIJ83082.1 hypothetical protein [Magnetococcales bacterium]